MHAYMCILTHTYSHICIATSRLAQKLPTTSFLILFCFVLFLFCFVFTISYPQRPSASVRKRCHPGSTAHNGLDLQAAQETHEQGPHFMAKLVALFISFLRLATSKSSQSICIRWASPTMLFAWASSTSTRTGRV